MEPRVDSGVAADRRDWIAPGIALAVVAYSVARRAQFLWVEWEIAALLGVVGVIIAQRGDSRGLGFQPSPSQGWWYWCRLSFWIGLGIGLLVAAFSAAAWFLHWPLAVPKTPPERVLPMSIYMCVTAPLTEEVVFRSLLAVALLSVLGSTGTIVASGLIFATAHILGGNPSPENQLAGFFFMWAFLGSGTILVPLAMHSAGNLIALLAQVVNWYWLPDRIP